MQASTAGHPGPEELIACADGEAPATVIAHVHTCTSCTERVTDYVQLQAGLRRSLFRFECPTAERLVEYAIDLLEPEERRLVAAHASECEDCGAELETLRFEELPVD